MGLGHAQRDDSNVPVMIESLFTTHAPALAALFRRRLGSNVDTDDLIQEVYVRMLGANLDGVRNVDAYLFAVAANLWKEQALLACRYLRLQQYTIIKYFREQRLPSMLMLMR